MSCIGPGKMVGLAYKGSRGIRWFDLDCEDDWGNLDCGVNEDGSAWVAVGNDEDGYERVTRALEDTPRGNRRLDFGKLREMIESRVAKYSG